ncbi:MAG: UvrB/UvrC motif-containing protein, partial [Chloroflexi bacterium]|nr:UvrB/UvrC motif-containing protein [Chloroflexota bacterium]
RAARHINGHVIMYADRVTDSMRAAIDETQRRRAIQTTHNFDHGINPQSIIKEVRDITERVRMIAEQKAPYPALPGVAGTGGDIPRDELARLIKDLEAQMKAAARDLEFEKAAVLRDQITDLRKLQVDQAQEDIRAKAEPRAR